MSERTRHEISDLIAAGKLIVGDGYRAKNEELSMDGIPFARAGNINNGFRFKDADRFPESNLSRVGNKVSQPGDVVFTSKGTVGRFAFVRPETPRFVYSPQLCFWRSVDQEQINPRFLYYWMHGREFFLQFKGVAGQTDMAEYVSLTDQRRMHISLPDSDEQNAIADMLGALDDKIDVNNEMDETLEGITAAVFRDWFVDFGPTRSKQEGWPRYLASNLWSVFPNRFDDDGKPEGWAITELGSVTSELRRGISPKYVTDGGVRVINQKCIRERTVTFAEARRHDDNAKSVTGREVEVGDILVNSTGIGTLGRVAQIWSIDEPTVVDSHVTVVRADKTKITATYLGMNLTTRESEIENLGEGSTGQTELNRARLGIMDIVLPDPKVLAAFDETVAPLIKRRVQNQTESQTLASMRDLLLPRLLSGEIRLKDAEKKVEEGL